MTIKLVTRCEQRCSRYSYLLYSSVSSLSDATTRSVRNRTRSFAMSGCGWLWPYYLGVIKIMKINGYLTNESICAGTSGGSLGALVACADIEPEVALEFIIKLSKSQQFFNDIDAGTKSELLPLLPHDTLKKCNGRLDVVVTRLWPNPSLTKPLITSTFQSKEELVDHVAASCFIPGYSARRLSTRILSSPPGHYYADGGFLAFMPNHIEDAIKVTPFNRSWVRPLMGKVQPDIFLRKREYSLGNLLKWSLLPAPPKVLKELFVAGESSASYWIDNDLNKNA